MQLFGFVDALKWRIRKKSENDSEVYDFGKMEEWSFTGLEETGGRADVKNLYIIVF